MGQEDPHSCLARAYTGTATPMETSMEGSQKPTGWPHNLAIPLLCIRLQDGRNSATEICTRLVIAALLVIAKASAGPRRAPAD